MKLAIFGLGYVGTVTAACLARNGHQVVGVEVDPLKLARLREGQSPITEPGLLELVREVVATGHLRVTADPDEAVLASELTLVCVGTPSDPNGEVDLRYLRQVAQEIGSALRQKRDYHAVVVRSTMLPGTTEKEILPLLESQSRKQAGKDFGLCVNPAFLREGSSIKDFDQPPFTLIGELDGRSGDLLHSLYRQIDAPITRTDLRTAEMVKHVSNVWHALKVSFANEIGNFCKRLTIDSHRVMEIFAQDTKLNISPAYLKPGFAFGGSCLPKDVRAFLHRARSEHLAVPLLEAILPSNNSQVAVGVEMVLRSGKKRVGILGLSFKDNTDDLQESPLVWVTETLIGKGFDIRVYDADVSLSQLIGANRRYIEQTIPHIASLMCNDLEEVVRHGEVLVVGKRYPQFAQLVASLDQGKIIVDLVRILHDPTGLRCQYHGICW